MAGRSYARSKRRRKSSGVAWHKGQVKHELCETTRQNAHFKARNVKADIKTGYTVERNYRKANGVKGVNRLSEAIQQPNPAFNESLAADNNIESAFDGRYVDNPRQVAGEKITDPNIDSKPADGMMLQVLI